MCATCGCGDDDATARITLLEPATPNVHHPHDHDHPHRDHLHHDELKHRPEAETGDRTIILEQQILAKNLSIAERNRAWLAGRGVLAINIMSSPGSGKTTLLERTIARLSGVLEVGVIEGDQETPLDAERIRACGSPVVQINTGAGCHLDAEMVERALVQLDPPPGSVLFIENVGNLVCPALFDLGEAHRVVLTSVTEGADKPLKYPHMYRAADLVLVNKMDLLPYVEFDLKRFSADVKKLNPQVELLTVTATTDEGVADWSNWLGSAARHWAKSLTLR